MADGDGVADGGAIGGGAIGGGAMAEPDAAGLLSPPLPPPYPSSHPHPSSQSHAQATPSYAGMLERLAGVQEADDAARRRDEDDAARTQARTRPRVHLTRTHAALVVLLLVAALAGSLTMLLRQSLAISTLEQAQVAALASGTGAASGIASGSASGSVSGDAFGDTSGDAAESASPSPASPAPETVTVTATAEATDDGKVDINAASADELDEVKGIGPAIAQRIVDYRAEHGRFASVDDLLDVPGIGVKTLESMRGELTAR